MQRRRWNLLLDWILLVAALATFATGFVLLVCFHMGHGVSAASALGLGKLAWLTVHRFSAAFVALGVVTHLGLHWRPFCSRLTSITRGRTRRRLDPELIMYTAFLIAAVTGFVAWLALEGSSPILGPAAIGRASSTRHPWIDLHHVSSQVSLVLIVHHVGHRWRSMVRRVRPAAVARRGVSSEPA